MTIAKKILSLCLTVLAATGLFYIFPSAALAKVINVNVVVDVPGLIADYGPGGTLDHPKVTTTGFGTKDIFMCTDRTHLATLGNPYEINCTADLSIKACDGDDIYFWTSTLSNGTPYNAVFNGIISSSVEYLHFGENKAEGRGQKAEGKKEGCKVFGNYNCLSELDITGESDIMAEPGFFNARGYGVTSNATDRENPIPNTQVTISKETKPVYKTTISGDPNQSGYYLGVVTVYEYGINKGTYSWWARMKIIGDNCTPTPVSQNKL
ncbi:MAG: hypothetical protein F6K47_07315 [Symploca sp. SIO2E6]|nr:hypothetical protein [Symploca sp. SIO2E6]